MTLHTSSEEKRLCTPLQKKKKGVYKPTEELIWYNIYTNMIHCPGCKYIPSSATLRSTSSWLCCMSWNCPPHVYTGAMYNLYTVNSSHYYYQWFDHIGLYGSDCVLTWEAAYLLSSSSTISKCFETQTWISLCVHGSIMYYFMANNAHIFCHSLCEFLVIQFLSFYFQKQVKRK